MFESLPGKCRVHDDKYDELFKLNWNVKNDKNWELKYNAEQKAKEFFGKCILVHGSPGVGKTYFMNAMKENCEEDTFIALAPTNKAARLIGGETIAKWWHTYVKRKDKLFSMLDKIRYIFISEISMVHAHYYRMFTLIKRVFPHITFVIEGTPACFRN